MNKDYDKILSESEKMNNEVKKFSTDFATQNVILNPNLQLFTNSISAD